MQRKGRQSWDNVPLEESSPESQLSQPQHLQARVQLTLVLHLRLEGKFSWETVAMHDDREPKEALVAEKEEKLNLVEESGGREESRAAAPEELRGREVVPACETPTPSSVVAPAAFQDDLIGTIIDQRYQIL